MQQCIVYLNSIRIHLQSLDNSIWWYFIISIAFYWSLTFALICDYKRPSAWESFCHHGLALVLLYLGWICNWHRIGSLLILLHDAAEFLLEASKVTFYAKCQRTCNFIYSIFTIVWLITRIGMYLRIVYSTSVEAPRVLSMYPVYYIFNALMILLFTLHCIWTRDVIKFGLYLNNKRV